MTPVPSGMYDMIDEPVDSKMAPSPFRRWAPLGVLALLAGSAYALGLHHYLSFAALAENYGALKLFVADHLAIAIGAYALVYVIVVALSLPGAAPLSIIGGLLFGWMISAPVTVAAATLGATIVFLVVKSSLGALMAERAGPFVKRLSSGFAKDGFNYLLFLRLVPAFPFFIVNAVAGLCGVALRPFVLATFLGIIPGSVVFAYLGSGFDSAIAAQSMAHQACIAEKGAENCTFTIDGLVLLTPELLIGFALLGVVALLPVLIKRLRKD